MHDEPLKIAKSLDLTVFSVRVDQALRYPERVKVLRTEDVAVFVWTANEPGVWRAAIELGVDGIITDRAGEYVGFRAVVVGARHPTDRRPAHRWRGVRSAYCRPFGGRHEKPELKRGSHVWMTDFVGFLPMPAGGEREAFLTSDYNAEMIEHIARFPRIRDRAVFVGNPDDVIPESFGPDLPKIPDWTKEHFTFSGYITGFTPPDVSDVAALREELGFAPGEKVVVVTVGGSGVGRSLLGKVIDAYPMAKARLPELRMIVVAGPRIAPESLPSHKGLEIHGYIHQLYRHLSVCDLAVVQGGLTTTMELTAARRPFLYFPLHNHFEQNFHVRHRLDRYRAGRYMEYATTDPDQIADAIVTEAGHEVSYLPVETDGALRAAELVAELL